VFSVLTRNQGFGSAEAGINTITVNPGFFRKELLTEESTNFSENTIEDYNERRAKVMAFWKGYNGQRPGDAANLRER